MNETSLFSGPGGALVLGMLLALAYLPFANHAPSTLRSIAKSVPLILFALAGFLGQIHPFATAGLLLSAVGDAALSRDGNRAFLYGLAAFALAHVLFALSFMALGGGILEAFWMMPLAALAAVGLALSTEIWLVPHSGALRWPVRLYVVLILIMALAAFGLPSGLWMVALGAGLFMLSDLVLSVRMFRMKKDDSRAAFAGLAVWILYISGQFLIVAGLLNA